MKKSKFLAMLMLSVFLGFSAMTFVSCSSSDDDDDDEQTTEQTTPAPSTPETGGKK